MPEKSKLPSFQKMKQTFKKTISALVQRVSPGLRRQQEEEQREEEQREEEQGEEEQGEEEQGEEEQREEEEEQEEIKEYDDESIFTDKEQIGSGTAA